MPTQLWLYPGKCLSGPEKIFESNIVTERTCRIPPYPEDGNYVVVNEPGAKPGDSFQNLTLIQYRTDDRNRLVEVNTFACSFGEWYWKVLRYEVDTKGFDSKSCPLLCANVSDAHSSVQRKKPSKDIQDEVQPQHLCKLPPYPPNGFYEVATKGTAKPGALLEAAYLIYRCHLRYKIVGNKNIVCFSGKWYSAAPKCVESRTEQRQEPRCRRWSDTKNEGIHSMSASAQPRANAVSNRTKNKTTFVFARAITNRCLLPEYPVDGKYFVLNKRDSVPGETQETLSLEYVCNGDSKIVGSKKVYCINGAWSSELPKCVREYSPSPTLRDRKWRMNRTVVNANHQDDVDDVPDERNDDGNRSFWGVRCGFITNTGTANGSSSLLPWRAGVYDRNTSPHRHECSGTIVATNLVVSAASCFWSNADGVLPASRFAVAAGKFYSGWDDQRDMFVQKSDVDKIAVPTRFRGELADFQSDIALLFLTKPVEYNDYVAPICMDFDIVMEEQQLKPNNVGKLGVWGGTDENVGESSGLKIKNIAYVDINKCITDASPEFRAYITSDKICAAASDGTEVCESHKGEGLAFPATDEKTNLVNYYLRGIVPGSRMRWPCITTTVATFTQMTAHEPFLKFHLKSAIW
ncbi:Modular serine protease [Eumeta japonica]|uniref:Modular serine protease n=1 Tax=Eumeta variegata TaxID=151549 RepID=A0A4C1V5I6_EUMVA|nr:Modular serine protease [Eumeta japonica]